MINGDDISIRQISILVNKLYTVEFSDEDGLGYKIWKTKGGAICDYIDLETGEESEGLSGYSVRSVIEDVTLFEYEFTFLRKYHQLEELIKNL